MRPKRPRVDWKAVWPIPLALTAAAGLAFGLFTAVAQAPKDDPGVPLKQAKAAYAEEKFVDAIEIINADLVPYINSGKLTAEQEKEFFELRARSLYYGQERMGIAQVENFKAIADAYEQAKRRGMAMEPADVGNLAESYLYTGDLEKAVALARTLEGRDEARRLRLYERFVKRLMASGTTQYPQVLNLLNAMLQMPTLTLEQRAWVVARQAQLRVDTGFAQEAITRLLREMPKFEGLAREQRADLLFILGKAYADGVDEQQALIVLNQAMAAALGRDSDGQSERDEEGRLREMVIDKFDPRIGEALVIQGRILANNGQVEEARERFQVVRDGFKESSVYVQALVGEADTAAQLADYDGALSYYMQAAERIAASGATAATPGISAVTLDMIGARLMDQHDRRVLESDPAEALKFVRKAQDVYQKLGAVPSEVHLAVARACRLNAQILLRDSMGVPASEPAPRPEEVSAVTATQAKGFLLDAGISFREHARMVTSVSNEGYLQSVLAAGDCFDQAGDAPAAIEAYMAFLDGDKSDARPGKAEAMFRLAQVYQSIGEFKAAAKLYKDLVYGGRGGFAGQWSDKSLVPLARCYVAEPKLAQNDAENGKEGGAPAAAPAAVGAGTGEEEADKPNEREAIALLNRAISGQTGIGPEAVQMREAQVELGELRYRRGEFREAIEVFNRLVDTYHDQTPRLPTVLFKRADAHRQLAMQILAVSDQRPLSERHELNEAQNSHLRDARAGYQEALAAILKRGSRATPIEKLYLRNSAFYTADCAYLLGQYEQAVAEYARAGEQYATDPAALVAKVQTVSAFIRLGRWDDAQVAAERAKSFLSTIPDEAWNDPKAMLPMERRHWEAWLAARVAIDRNRVATASVNTP